MAYNGYLADLFFNACAIVMWAAFLWRVLDGPRFRVWVTVLLAALIGAAYMAATLLLTTVGQLRALMFPVCSLAMAFLLFRGTPGWGFWCLGGGGGVSWSRSRRSSRAGCSWS